MNISNNIKCIKTKNILVIGDVMLDRYFNGKVKRISPEAPVPVFRKTSEYCVPGGASNVATNLVAAGQKTYVAGIIGDDANGKSLCSLLEQKNINTDYMEVGFRETTVKTRFMADSRQQVLRLDVENEEPIDVEFANAFISKIRPQIQQGKFNLIVLSDYNKGFLTEYLIQNIISICNDCGLKVLIDVKGNNFKKYANAFLIKPNKKELHDLTGMHVDDLSDVKMAAECLRANSNVTYVLTTCGEDGMVLTGESESIKINANGPEVFDVTGAGDTSLAYVATCIANGISMEDSIRIANFAAGLQVAKIGTSSIYLQEVVDSLSSDNDIVSQKLIDREDAKRIRERYADKIIVFTNGCFDILHAGHVRYLSGAAKEGDILILGLNSDASIKRIKGNERPINNQYDRAEVLCNLKSVDYVVIFDEDTPLELIDDIRPDILVKGADYEGKEIVGANLVEKRGGKVKLIPFLQGHSTSKIIKKIREYDI